MPSLIHEALVSLFHNEPRLAPELLERVFGLPVPENTSAIRQDPTLGQVTPTEYHADAVVVMRGDEPVQAIVVEVQLSRDDRKLYSWPVYTVTLRARLQCPVALLVVTPHEDVATWAEQAIEIGPGCHFSPRVVGPDVVPDIVNIDDARANPELAVLSVLAHRGGPSAETRASAAWRAAQELDVERATLYSDLILSVMGQAARAGLEDLMKINYEYQSDFVRKYVLQGREEGREEGCRDVLRRQLHCLGVELDADTSRRLGAASADVLESIAGELVVIRDPMRLLDAIQNRLRATD